MGTPHGFVDRVPAAHSEEIRVGDAVHRTGNSHPLVNGVRILQALGAEEGDRIGSYCHHASLAGKGQQINGIRQVENVYTTRLPVGVSTLTMDMRNPRNTAASLSHA